MLAELGREGLGVDCLDARQDIQNAHGLGAAFTRHQRQRAAVGRERVEPVGDHAGRLALARDPVGQRGRDHDGKLGRVKAGARVVVLQVEVEEQHRFQRNRRLEQLGLHPAGGRRGFPIDAAQRVAGLVIALADRAGGVFEDRLFMPHGAHRRVGGQLDLCQGDDPRVDGQVVGRAFALVFCAHPEQVAARNPQRADGVEAALVRLERVIQAGFLARADADHLRKGARLGDFDRVVILHAQPHRRQPGAVGDI